jgi:fucose 4-O-acetylase-like acetyltransferase
LYIYSFHMPLFFFLSGLMLTQARLNQGLLATIRYYAQRLLIPNLLFSVITWVPWALFTRHRGADASLGISVWKPLVGTFYGIGVDGWLQHNAMLWFFPCLFLVHIAFHCLWNNLRGHQLAAAVGACTVLGYALVERLPIRLPWGAEIALLAMPFYGAGYYLSVRQGGLPQPGTPMAIGVVVLALLQFVSILGNGRVDMNFLSLENPFLFYLGAFSGIGVLVGLAGFFPCHPLYARIGDGAILAFPLHRPFFSIFSGLGLLFVADMQAFKASVWGSVVYTVGAITLALVLWPHVRRSAPWLVGGR